MRPGDMVIGISTSGRSPNVLRALDHANQSGGVSIGITGLGGEPLRRLAHETLVVSSSNVQRIEDVASIAAHLACLLTCQMLAEAEVTKRVASSGGRSSIAYS